MKYAIVCALLTAPFVHADDSTRLIKAELLLTAMHVEQQQKEMMDQMSQMVIGQVKQQMEKQGPVSDAEMAKMEDRQKRLFALVAEKTSWRNMKPVFIKAYADTFTETELDGIIAFYATPAGRAMVAKQPALNTKIMGSVQAQMQDLMPKIEAIMKDQQ
ncbi:MAG: DUF2059 domain-containing protein [Bryobacteraceae bacterium]|jgi:hypothetical protein